ncbi:CheR family methyltransferase [Sandaracinus amylolyticus]|uniref:CheR family methyltransferase n=1 Tax=Sandaracinus amylolyticus TaxID=927083 RepID=UPI001F3DFB54|nr:CheR family methyltransferase [Sandaracinus amylolyticus]UJR81325.1 Protein-glutamate O-methyltransferase [Sandaracinus amylolyticus]
MIARRARLDPATRVALEQMLAREAGLVFDEGLEPRLADAAQRAASTVGASDASTLVARASAGDREAVDALLSAAVVGETWFFRDLPRVAMVRDRFVPEALAARGRARIWSCACASGEEAWSLAAMALSVPGASASRVEVLGTDLDPNALARARAGGYRSWSLRHVPDDLRDRWLERAGEGYRVHDSLRGVVGFERLNLVHLASGASMPQGRWDVVFCRNVLMYLEPEVARRVLLQLAGALEEGGALVLGGAEPLLPHEIASWARIDLGGNVLVRPRAGEPERVQRVESAPVGPAARRAAPLPPPRRVAPVAPAAAPQRATDAVAEAIALADRGDVESALARLAQLDAEARPLALRAMLLESLDRSEDAARAAERALVLDPGRVDAAIVAARAHARLGDAARARHHVNRARRALAVLPQDATIDLLPETSRATLLALLDGLERRLGAEKAT